MNDNKTYYCDWRLKNVCAYCGEYAETEDHVPSRCFLDNPLPSNPPVVPCCHDCNERFSLDEEYVSCIIDCMKEGTADIQSIQRKKTRLTMAHSAALAERIRKQYRNFYGYYYWEYERDRFEVVIKKLAFGHLAYMNESLLFDAEFHFTMRILDKMSPAERDAFERPYYGSLLPEVGSRALKHVVVAYGNPAKSCSSMPMSNWMIVQPNRYRYCTSIEGDKVKFVIAEYLAVEVHIADE